VEIEGSSDEVATRLLDDVSHLPYGAWAPSVVGSGSHARASVSRTSYSLTATMAMQAVTSLSTNFMAPQMPNDD
jgi:hypothetical protein